MNKIEKLIEEFCPKGVPMMQLGELVKIRNGKDFKHLGLGSVPVYGSGGVMTHVNSSVHEQASVLIPRKGSLKNLFYVDKPFWTVDTIFWTEIGPLVEAKFLFYVLETKRLADLNVAGGVPSLTQTMLNGVTIPTPPIRVQKEIVLILNKFAQLEAELEAELNARRSQFNFFVDVLTSAEKAHQFGGLTAPLGDLGKFVRGSGLQKSDLCDEGAPALHYGQIFTYYKTKIHSAKSMVTPKLAASIRQAEYGDVIIATTSENIEDVCKSVVWLGEGNLAVGGETFIFKHELDPLYATYLFRSSDFQYQKLSHISGTKVKRVSGKALEKLTVSVPDREAQVRIGSFLSQLEDLLGDVNEGLPAEIQARRKQYEYYRNKLLTFKELDSV